MRSTMLWMIMTRKKPKLLHSPTTNPRSEITTLYLFSIRTCGCYFWPWVCGLNSKHLKLELKKTKTLRCGVAVCQFLNCSPWFPVFWCPFMLSIVSKMVNVSTFMSTTLNQNRSKRKEKTLLHRCNLHVWQQLPRAGGAFARWRRDAICHARLKVFHEMVEKEIEWKHLYYERQMITY